MGDYKTLAFILIGLIAAIIGGLFAQSAKKSGKMAPFIISLILAAVSFVFIIIAVLTLVF